MWLLEMMIIFFAWRYINQWIMLAAVPNKFRLLMVVFWQQYLRCSEFCWFLFHNSTWGLEVQDIDDSVLTTVPDKLRMLLVLPLSTLSAKIRPERLRITMILFWQQYLQVQNIVGFASDHINYQDQTSEVQNIDDSVLTTVSEIERFRRLMILFCQQYLRSRGSEYW